MTWCIVSRWSRIHDEKDGKMRSAALPERRKREASMMSYQPTLRPTAEREVNRSDVRWSSSWCWTLSDGELNIIIVTYPGRSDSGQIYTSTLTRSIFRAGIELTQSNNNFEKTSWWRRATDIPTLEDSNISKKSYVCTYGRQKQGDWKKMPVVG